VTISRVRAIFNLLILGRRMGLRLLDQVFRNVTLPPLFSIEFQRVMRHFAVIQSISSPLKPFIMKKPGKRGLRTAMTVLCLVIMGAGLFLSSGTQTVKARALECGNVTTDEVIGFLTPLGYDVISVSDIPGSCDKCCDTQFEYHTHVQINEGRIVGFEDMPAGCSHE
jgi:hypothetical protein